MITIVTAATLVHRPERSHVEISDPDEVVDYLDSTCHTRLRLTHAVEPERVEATPFTHTRIDVGPFLVDEVYVPGELKASPDPLNRVAAVWATDGAIAGSCAGMDGGARAGEIMLVSQPDLPHELHTYDLTAISVLIDLELIAGMATGLPGAQSSMPIRFASLRPVDARASQLWRDTVRYIQRSVLADDATATPLVLGQAGRLLAAATLSAFPNSVITAPTAADRRDHHPALLRRAMEFMEENAANDIALADIASAVRVTPRAVQYMFRRHLDMTPLQYLRRVRLDRVHHELVAADRQQHTVSGLAARWGFANTGRFAVLYRQTYGVSPHTTLRDS